MVCLECCLTYIVLKIVESNSKYRALRDDDYPDAPNAHGSRIDVDIKMARRRYAIASADDLYEPIHTGFCSTDMCHIYAICDTHRLILRILRIVHTNFCTNLMQNEDRNYDPRKEILPWRMSTSVAQNFQFEIGLDFWLKIKFATRRFKICKFPNQMDSGVVLEKMAGKIDKFCYNGKN